MPLIAAFVQVYPSKLAQLELYSNSDADADSVAVTVLDLFVALSINLSVPFALCFDWH